MGDKLKGERCKRARKRGGGGGEKREGIYRERERQITGNKQGNVKDRHRENKKDTGRER